MAEYSEQIYAALLVQVPGVGSKLLFELKTHFGSYYSAWEANPVEWLDVPGVTAGLKDRFANFRDSSDPAVFANSLSKMGVQVITLSDANYPGLLMEIPGAPPVLYLKGNPACLMPDKVSIVGTRKASDYGRETARKIARDLADVGLAIVSGMALGIDGAAHRGALEAGGMTIAVLGSGVDVVYPEEHQQLYEEICKSGLLISELPPGTPPLREHFPSRNRIISGLSMVTLVVEAPLNSGSLITANYALEQGRMVFAVPGNVNSYSFRGCHKLIKDGAKLTEDADDIIAELGISKFELLKLQRGKLQESLFTEEVRGIETQEKEEQEKKPVSPRKQRVRRGDVGAVEQPPSTALEEEKKTAYREEELAILNELSYDEGIHINNLARKLRLSIAELSARLTLLEIKGLVKSLPGGFYQRL